MSDRIARALNRSGATRPVALDISKAFDRVRHAALLHKLKSYGVSGQIFDLISSFLSNRRLRVVLDGKSLHKNIQLMLVLHFSCCILMTFLMMSSVILLSMLMILFSILSVIRHLICGNNLNWLLNLNLIFEAGLRNGLLIFSARKTQLVSFDLSNNTGSIDVKMDGSAFEEKSSFMMLGLTSSKLDWGLLHYLYC